MGRKRLLIIISILILILAILIHKFHQKTAAISPSNLQTSKHLTAEQQQFIEKVLPAIRTANDAVFKERQQLLNLHVSWAAHTQLEDAQMAMLNSLITKYKLSQFNITAEEDWLLLIKRIDIIPASLILAQAITESGWGRSRLFKLSNNLFGVRCYTEGCGVIPKQRPLKASFEVKKYSAIQGSVADLIYTYNTYIAYRQLRDTRLHLRQQDKPVTGSALLTGLQQYSAIGEDYVTRLKLIIEGFHLQQYTRQFSSSTT